MKCGIEIHQRIAGRKLFCNCVPAATDKQENARGSESPPPDVEFSRRLHAVLSEIGELDAAVRLESIRHRAMHYSAPAHSSCLVEADEEPPHRINNEALSAVLLFCKLLHSPTVDEIHIMRKNVIDGSNTSGFQRTAVVGLGGSIKTPVGALGIQSICIEEESAGILEAGKEATADFELSRLGIPLVEIATEPELKSGKEAQEAALAIGTLLRKTGLVQRGIGTIRQDLNVSIPEGARVEIKGVQELSMIAATVDIEVQRQQKLLALVEEIRAKLSGKEIPAEFVDLTGIFEGTQCQLVGKALKAGARVFGMKLPGHEGLLGRELAPNRRYGSELADYARAAGIRGLIHSDENLAKYGFSEDELSELKVALSLSPGDAFAMVVGEQKKALAALSEVCNRANFLGVPEETRKANPDGTSSYMRPLPGKARMYPETDVPPIRITQELVSEVSAMEKRVEKMEDEKEGLLSKVAPELSSQLAGAKNLISHNPSFQSSAGSPELATFAAALEAGIDSKFAATTLTNTLQSLKREGIDTKALDEPKMLEVFDAVQKGDITKQAALDVLRVICTEPNSTPQETASKLGITKFSAKELRDIISKEKLDFKEMMSKYRLRVDASEAQELLKTKK